MARLTQKEIDLIVKCRLLGLKEIIDRLGGEECTRVDGPEDRFTDLGWDVIREAHAQATNSALCLFEVMVNITRLDTVMLQDCLTFMEVASAALRGVLAQPNAPDAVLVGPMSEITSLSLLLDERVRRWFTETAGPDLTRDQQLFYTGLLNEAAPSETASSKEPSRALGQRNRFVQEHRDGFFELLVDAPEIPATRSPEIHPSHAIKGDILRECSDDETPFELWRGTRRIGDPEWWQVRHLFAGLRDDAVVEAPAHGAMRCVGEHPAVAMIRRCNKTPGKIGCKRSEISRSFVFCARTDISGTSIRRGDVVLYRYRGSSTPRLRLRGATHEAVPQSQFATVAEHFDSLECVHDPLHEGGFWPQCVARLLARAQKPDAKLSRSRLVIVRNLDLVSRPITATSDAAAIFELLAQVGGRMPA